MLDLGAWFDESRAIPGEDAPIPHGADLSDDD